MNFDGIAAGLGTFLIIGLLHPVVIKMEYHFGTRAWPSFLIAGLGCIGLSLFSSVPLLSTLLAISGFSLLWSIREIFEQERRVKKGWFPKNPNRCEMNGKECRK